MTIQSRTGVVLASGNDSVLDYLYNLKDFLVTDCSWTVPRSSDGTTGGAGDNISAFGDLSQYVATTSESWMVLADPGGGREFLWHRDNTSDTNWVLKYSPANGFTGGDSGNPPTATDEQSIHVLDAIFTSTAGTIVSQYTADDAAPYGMACFAHVSGATTARGAYAFIPIDVAAPGETDAMVFFYDGGSAGHVRGEYSDETGITSNGQVQAMMPGTTTMSTCPALTYNSNSSGGAVVFPNDAPQDNNSDDIGAPILFCRRSGLAGTNRVKGFSSFAQWNGVTRAPLETFNLSTTARISFGDVNFPWEQSLTPVNS